MQKVAKKMDFGSYHVVDIALHLFYDGLGYNGMASQVGIANFDPENPSGKHSTTRTIEDELFAALLRSRLVPSIKESNFTRCGRTDTGVNATGQIVGLRVRGNKKDKPEQDQTLAYDRMLNGNLPSSIRVVRWGLVKDSFNARFDCIYREYCYFFDASGLAMDKMTDALCHLVGTHDFKNLSCKDKSKPDKSTIRTVIGARFEKKEYNIHVLVIRGSAFLYHQVRCIMGILLEIGSGAKKPDIVSDLLVADTKISYVMAAPEQLFLTECGYPDGTINWVKEGQRPTRELRNFHACRVFALNMIDT